MLNFKVEAADAGTRLDVFIGQCCPTWPRTQIKRAIDKSAILVNGKSCDKAGRKCNAGDIIAFEAPKAPVDLTQPQPEAISLDIVYADEDIVVINKPCGLVVHPGAGHLDGTLVNALLHFDAAIADVGEPDRPGIAHRLDRETSGLMVCARSQRAYEKLVQMFARHDVHRQYWAICFAPKLAPNGTFDTPYGRHPTQRVKFTCFASHAPTGEALKRAITHYEVLDRAPSGYALVTCRLETGRTHQVRVHLSEHDAPILGDALYAPQKLATHRAIDRLALHAGRLSFDHPVTGAPLSFDAPLPESMIKALDALHLKH